MSTGSTPDSARVFRSLSERFPCVRGPFLSGLAEALLGASREYRVHPKHPKLMGGLCDAFLGTCFVCGVRPGLTRISKSPLRMPPVSWGSTPKSRKGFRIVIADLLSSISFFFLVLCCERWCFHSFSIVFVCPRALVT